MNHYFTNNENIKSEEKNIKVKIKDTELIFTVDNGVFSKKGLDFGTRTLLETIPELHGQVLDFGCGYGPIGIYIKKNNEVEVDMIDINKRSVNLAKKNALLNKVEVNVFESDVYSNVKNKYDFIITNPPIRIGKQKLYEILFNATKYFKVGDRIGTVNYIHIYANEMDDRIIDDILSINSNIWISFNGKALNRVEALNYAKDNIIKAIDDPNDLYDFYGYFQDAVILQTISETVLWGNIEELIKAYKDRLVAVADPEDNFHKDTQIFRPRGPSSVC